MVVTPGDGVVVVHYGHLVSGGQSPTTMHYLGPNVSSVEVKTSCDRKTTIPSWYSDSHVVTDVWSRRAH